MTGGTIRIEDLRAPVLTDFQRAAIDYARTQPSSLAVADLLAAARERTGLDDVGPDDYEARLAVMTTAVEDDGGLNPLGRMIVRDRFVRLLAQRLRFTDLVRRHPEILDVELDPPIVVIGLPRTGTTHLVNLIAADSRLRSLPYWESLEPFPGPGDGPGRDGTDERYRRCVRAYDAQMAMAPLVKAMHHQHPQAIEEEIELEDLDFASYTLEWHARVPGWRDHYLSLDQRPHYAYLRRVLQALTWFRGPRRWVLKSPQHLEQIPALVATFPDATFAVTHRDPVSVVQSAATMLAYGDRVRRDAIEPEALGEYWVARIARLLDACVRDHHLLPADRTVDVTFDALIADDVGAVSDVYARAGFELTDRARAELRTYTDANPRGRHGQVVYDLRGDFGLEPAAVRERFAAYLARFPQVRPEVE